MKIGILGGTFDPVHRGHLQLAQKARSQFSLDKVIFVPAYQPPHKQTSPFLASARDRYEMVRLAIEGALDGLPLWRGQTARERAIELFSQLRVWDTEHNNGVLIYVLLADQAVEIVADRGIHARASMHTWNAICQHMQAAFASSDFQIGAVRGIAALSHSMREHYPRSRDARNELPNIPVIVRR